MLGYELPVDDRVRVRRRRTSAGRDRIAAAASSRRRLTEVYTDNHFEKKSVVHEAYHLSHGFWFLSLLPLDARVHQMSFY